MIKKNIGLCVVTVFALATAVSAFEKSPATLNYEAPAADPEIIDAPPTPAEELFAAVRRSDGVAVVQLLRTYDLDDAFLAINSERHAVLMVDEEGCTLLQVAAQYAEAAIIGMLTRKGYNVCYRLYRSYPAWINLKQETYPGWTALHFAAARGDVSVIKKLLVNRADRRIKSADNKTALDVAQEHNNAEAVHTLRTYLLAIDCCCVS